MAGSNLPPPPAGSPLPNPGSGPFPGYQPTPNQQPTGFPGIGSQPAGGPLVEPASGGKFPPAAWLAILAVAIGGGALGVYLVTRDSSESSVQTTTTVSVNETTEPSTPSSQPPTTLDNLTIATLPATTPATTPAPTTNAVPTTPAPTTVAPTTAPAPTATSAPAGEPPAADPPGEAVPTELAAGSYSVPDELPPGTYRVETGWDLTDDEGFLVNLQLVFDGPSLLVIPEDADGYTAELYGHAESTEFTGPLDPTTYNGGIFMVGYDIAPGTYTVTAEYGTASSTRYDESLEIIERVESPTVTVVIESTDFAFEFDGKLTPAG